MLKYAGSIFAQSNLNAVSAPDIPDLSAGFMYPAADFVLCRDSEGRVITRYGDMAWDFSSYRLSEKPGGCLRFDRFFNGDDFAQSALVEEAKYIMFCLIYYIGKGRVGRLSPASFLKYFYILMWGARFCFKQRDNTLVHSLTLRQLFSIPPYLAAFSVAESKKYEFGRKLKALLNHLVTVGSDRLGWMVVNPKMIRGSGAEVVFQHPVIPVGIYLGVINTLSVHLDDIHRNIDSLSNFVRCFTDPLYGRLHKAQNKMGGGGKEFWRPDFLQAVKLNRMNDLLVGDFSCVDRRTFAHSLLSIQFLLKCVIHLYTGMRDQEVMRMRRNCLSEEEVTPNVYDDLDLLRDESKVVSIISTTTKYEGYRKSESWLATDEVVKAIEVARCISLALSSVYGVDESLDGPLFLNPAILIKKKVSSSVGLLSRKNVRSGWMDSLVISKADLEELALSDPSRDFNSEEKFAIGNVWPLTSHQFRRSLSFYASSSGFVSLPTLKTQFKHLTMEMARYYRSGFENIKTIFGFYDEKVGDFVLPASHIAFEFQTGMSMSVVSNLLLEVFGRDAPLFGGTGSYMEKQKRKVDKGEICVEECRSETLVKVGKGQISFRSTLLGGCTKVGRCDSFLLGDFTACFSCEGAIIKPDNVVRVIESVTLELGIHPVGSAEYQIANSELEVLSRVKAKAERGGKFHE